MLEVQKNNPLHGLKLEILLTELVDHYGWETLAGALNLNCFKSNPSIPSSLKFLRKTEWAREKVEGFYLYKFKRLPKPDDEQYELPPRDRTIPLSQKPRSPADISTIKPEPRTNKNTRVNSKASQPRSSSDSEPSTKVWSGWKTKPDSD